jgi:hypothetical protein
MLLPQVHQELTRAAARPRVVRRVGGRVSRAVAAALLVLLVAAPVAQGHFASHPVHASSSQSRESA